MSAERKAKLVEYANEMSDAIKSAGNMTPEVEAWISAVPSLSDELPDRAWGNGHEVVYARCFKRARTGKW